MLLCIDASRRFGDWKVYTSIAGGVAIDALKLRQSLNLDGNEIPMEGQLSLFAPEAGLIQPIFNATFGVSYQWRAR